MLFLSCRSHWPSSSPLTALLFLWLVAQSGLTLCNTMDCGPPILCPWDSPGKKTKVGCRALLQGIFLTRGWDPGLPLCRRILYRVSRRGKPTALVWTTVTHFSAGHNKHHLISRACGGVRMGRLHTHFCLLPLFPCTSPEGSRQQQKITSERNLKLCCTFDCFICLKNRSVSQKLCPSKEDVWDTCMGIPRS